ncbi:MAG TPA: OadG family protein [Candidatus Coprenecus stercoravium]|uniref:OadG family protein n=1 Tax=Candidatus Coprenecus stercoravium TaxID=2840735 RepID=A0A9D2GQB6_9BACT|nr:OadG family protein [Candidatus Coprenecus stercoravium]
MNKLRVILVSGLAAVLSVMSLNAQSQSDMRLNELLIYNTSDFEDDFGFRNGWIELFNASYGTVDIGGCFLTNDRGNLTKYIIPKADVLTKIPPRQHTLFWADNEPFRGTFHINFTLEESDTVFFVSSDGKTIIDLIAVPKDLDTNQSYGRTEDGVGSIDGSGDGWGIMPRTSPSTNNAGVDDETKSQIMARNDPNGLFITLTAMSVVFLALIILCFIFKFTGHIAVNKLQRKSSAATADSEASGTHVKETSAETYAAIAFALHLYQEENEAHDNESLTITMSHTDRSYSPWNSKIYTLRQTPTVRKNHR